MEWRYILHTAGEQENEPSLDLMIDKQSLKVLVYPHQESDMAAGS